MLFFEFTFLFLFLPLVLAGYRLLPLKLRNPWLLVCSLAFYSASSMRFLPILVFSIGVDYVVARRIASSTGPRARLAWLMASLTTNLGLLAWFKYRAFFASSINAVAGTDLPVLAAALPVGISFYTFQSMSYSIDVYRRADEPTRDAVLFGTYVSLFPQLIAGPIVRYSELREELMALRRPDAAQVVRGIILFSAGLAKKILVADTLAAVAAPYFARGSVGLLDGWASMLLFAGQIYFDFSGYSDMAIGLGALLGFTFPINFNAPYRAVSFSDFWRRWHMTLSRWLRDYLYIPLGGNQRGPVRTYLHLMVTMLLGGLWHGASWNFVLWGGLHGAALAIERFLGRRWTGPRPPRWLASLLVFCVVTLIWVPFKLERLDLVGAWWKAMFGIHGLGQIDAVTAVTVVGALALFFIPTPTHLWSTRASAPKLLLSMGLFFAALVLAYGRAENSPFLYFRF